MTDTVKLALVQTAASEDPAVNLDKAVRCIEEAASRGAQIICLQELFRSVYFCRSEDDGFFDLAESIPGPSTEKMALLAQKHGVVVIASLFEKRAAGVYHNTAVVLDADGSMAGRYRKMHIPDDPGFYEKYYFSPGDLGFRVFETRFGKIAVLICWDQWFPEAARIAALKGAQILFYPTAIGWGDQETEATRRRQLDGWQIVQRGHAVANEVYVAAANRIGREGNLTFWGHSFVADPFGAVLAEASESKEEILFADCDLSAIETNRRNWPFLRDRRIDAYEPLLARFLDES